MTTTAIEVRSLSGSLVSTHAGNDALRDAIGACPSRGTILLPAGNWSIGAGDAGVDPVSINKALTIRGTVVVRGTRSLGGSKGKRRRAIMGGGGIPTWASTICGLPSDNNYNVPGASSTGPSIFFVRNGAGIGDGVTFEDVNIRPDRIAQGSDDPYPKDRNITGIRVQNGPDVGAAPTPVVLRRVGISNAGAAFSCERIPDENGNAVPDSQITLTIEHSLISDTYGCVTPTGTKRLNIHSHGGFLSGGELTIRHCVLRRLGYIPGSSQYRASNKNQGLYGRAGVLIMEDNLIDTVSHCAIQVRACRAITRRNTILRAAMGIGVGHHESPERWQGDLDSENDFILAPSAIYADADQDPETPDVPTIGTGLQLDYHKHARVRNMLIDFAGGETGGWAGLHIGHVSTHATLGSIDFDGIDVRGWPLGLWVLEPLLARHAFRGVTVRETPSGGKPWSTRWIDNGEPSQAIGGDWASVAIPGFDAAAVLP